ncbi:MAG: (Fe-S)-binding protein [Candidatus Hydrothermarchaeaceae archaeon]
MGTEALAAFAQMCNQCAICSGTCPKARVKPGFLPRRMVYNVITGNAARVVDSGDAWHCLTCKKCQVNCPMGVDFTSIVRELRREMLSGGNGAVIAHANTFGPSLISIMKNSDLTPAHQKYLAEDIRISDDGKVLYFMGCTAFMDIVFKDDVGFEGMEVANNTIRLLNAVGVEPAVLDGEKCCGHDQLFRGEYEVFDELAEQNAETLKGYDTIVTSCPECYRALAVDYEEMLGVELNVKHVSEFLLEHKDKLAADGSDKKAVTFHDSCRLGRYMGVYEEPRELLRAVGYEVREMVNTQGEAICCGVPQFVNCDDENKEIRRRRMEDAVATGAELMVTPCMKCQIHLKCLQRDGSERQMGKEYPIEILDFSTALVKNLKKGDA